MSKASLWHFCFAILYISSFVQCNKVGIIQLDETNWDLMLEGEWMVEFFAPWCPACKQLEKVWKEYSGWAKDLSINVAQVDVTVSPGLSGRFMVTALPTIFHVIDGQFRQYRGSREREAFISFIEEKQWQKVDAIPGWKSPSSFTMSTISYFFKLSQILRKVHTKLMEDYGIPTWGSYVIFAVATIIIGALLGLLLVYLIDLIYPPHLPYVDLNDKKKKLNQSKDSDEEKDDTEDLIDDRPTSQKNVKKKSRKTD